MLLPKLGSTKLHLVSLLPILLSADAFPICIAIERLPLWLCSRVVTIFAISCCSRNLCIIVFVLSITQLLFQSIIGIATNLRYFAFCWSLKTLKWLESWFLLHLQVCGCSQDSVCLILHCGLAWLFDTGIIVNALVQKGTLAVRGWGLLLVSLLHYQI